MASISLELVPFSIPTSVSVKMPPGKREDGMKPSPSFKLEDLSEEILAALCEEFTASVFAAAGKSL